MNTTTALVPALSNLKSEQVVALTTGKGKVVGARVIFGGTVKASDVRKSLKAANPKLKGGELTIKVNEVITGKNTVAWAEVQVAIEGMRQAGYTPDHADVRAKGGLVRFVKAVAPAPKKVQATDDQIAAMSKEERDELIAKLMAA